MATPATKSNKPAQVAPLAVAAAKAKPAIVPVAKAVPTAKAADAPVSAETKTAKPARATRDACAAVRKELSITDTIVVGKANNARQGSLRYNIIAAIQGSKTVAEAMDKQVNGAGKYASEPYGIKKVDIGFTIGNGFITTTPAK